MNKLLIDIVQHNYLLVKLNINKNNLKNLEQILKDIC